MKQNHVDIQYFMDSKLKSIPPEKQPYFSQSLQVLQDGIQLRTPFSRLPGLILAFFLLPLTWFALGMAHYLEWIVLSPLTGFAWGVFVFPVIFGLIYFFYPFVRKGPKLQIKKDCVCLDGKSKKSFSLDVNFYGSILYQEKEQMALLVLQNVKEETLFLVGYYSKEYPFPQEILPLTTLHFSLQQIATEQMSAWIVPSLSKELFPALIHALWEHPNFQANPRLPIARKQHTLRFDKEHITWLFQDEYYRSFPYQNFIFQPLTYYSKSAQVHYLLYQVETTITQTEAKKQQDGASPSLMIAVEWPTPLDLSKLPKATKEMTQKAVLLNAVEFLLFAQALYYKNAISSPLSILERFQQH